MPSDTEIVCPFCGHRKLLTGDPPYPLVFEAHGDFEVYHCPCGAVASPTGHGAEPKWLPECLEYVLCNHFLNEQRGLCYVRRNDATHTNPSLVVMWANRRISPGSP